MGVVAGAILMRALKGQANDCTRISIVLNQQLHFFKLIRLHKFHRLCRPAKVPYRYLRLKDVEISTCSSARERGKYLHQSVVGNDRSV